MTQLTVRSGVVGLLQGATGTQEVYGLGLNFGLPLSLYAVLIDGYPLTQTYAPVPVILYDAYEIVGALVVPHPLSWVFRSWVAAMVSVDLTTNMRPTQAREEEVIDTIGAKSDEADQ